MKHIAAKLFFSAVLVFAASGIAAAFTSTAKTFSVDFPAGWSKPVVDTDGNVQSDAPGGTNQGWCRANSNPLATLKNSTQAQINATYGAPLDQATWASVLSVDPTKVKLLANSSKIVNGHVVQYATISFAADVVGVTATGRFASHILPGRMVNAGCFAPTKQFEFIKGAFESVVTSLKPL
jgi:hypothetical protein